MLFFMKKSSRWYMLTITVKIKRQNSTLETRLRFAGARAAFSIVNTSR